MAITLSQITDKYDVRKDKPYFPLNSLRLVYLIFAETIAAADENLVNERGQSILALIPKVQALLDARTSNRASGGPKTADEEWMSIQNEIVGVLDVIDSPKVRALIEHVFSYVFPLQDTLLISLYRDLSSSKQMSLENIYTVFHIRSMDSILYSGLVGAILERGAEAGQIPPSMQSSLNYKLNALYQLNDLVDAIVYAEEDTQSQNFSPLELIKNTATDPDQAKQMIKTLANTFEKRIQAYPLSEDTEKLLAEFSRGLIEVIGKGKK